MGIEKIRKKINEATKARRMRIRSIIDLIKRQHNRELPYIKESIIKDSYAIFRLRGDIDANTIPDIAPSRQMEKELSDKHIILDFKEVQHVDTATLAILVDVFNKLKIKKRKLAIIHATKTLKNYITILNLKDFVKIYTNEQLAVKAFLGKK